MEAVNKKQEVERNGRNGEEIGSDYAEERRRIESGSGAANGIRQGNGVEVLGGIQATKARVGGKRREGRRAMGAGRVVENTELHRERSSEAKVHRENGRTVKGHT